MIEDLKMCLAILAIWFASWVLPGGHPSQPCLREAMRAME